MRTISKTQINSSLVSVNFRPEKQTITKTWLSSKEWVTTMVEAAIILNEFSQQDMVWEMLRLNGYNAYENFNLQAFRTKGGIVGFVLYEIDSEYNRRTYKAYNEVHILVYPRHGSPNYSLLYSFSPISLWEGYILENVMEHHFISFLDYTTPNIGIAIEQLQREGENKE